MRGRRFWLLGTLAAVAAVFTLWTVFWPLEEPAPLVQFRERLGSRSGVFRGRYLGGFETSSFQPCGSSEHWWVELEPFHEESIRSQLNHSLTHPNGEIYVEWRGRRTARGKFGHLGQYVRKLEVGELIAARDTVPSECK